MTPVKGRHWLHCRQRQSFTGWFLSWPLNVNAINLRCWILVQLKDGTCEGMTLTALPWASSLHRLVSFVAMNWICFGGYWRMAPVKGWHWLHCRQRQAFTGWFLSWRWIEFVLVANFLTTTSVSLLRWSWCLTTHLLMPSKKMISARHLMLFLVFRLSSTN